MSAYCCYCSLRHCRLLKNLRWVVGERQRRSGGAGRIVDSVTNWPVPRLMMNCWLPAPYFPALVSLVFPKVTSVTLSFSNGWLSFLQRPSRKWKTDSLSLLILQQSICGAWRDIHLPALVHPVREEKWLSSGLMPSSSAALMAGKSKLYITVLCVNAGTQTTWQMGLSCLLIVGKLICVYRLPKMAT